MVSERHRTRQARTAVLLAALCVTGGLATPATAAPDPKKAIFGPIAAADGTSAFPTYRDLGVGTYQYRLRWREVAPSRPRSPTSPRERTYIWPDELDFALDQAKLNGMQVAVTVDSTPAWANGGFSGRVAPRRAADYGHFMRAASRRFPAVRAWRVWDDTNDARSFAPQDPARYAELLDSAYAAVKAVNRRDRVIGGNTVSKGSTLPLAWVDGMVLPDGRPPRLDEYGHSPYGERPATFGLPSRGDGIVDFADLATLGKAADRAFTRPRRRLVPLFLAKYSVVSDHPDGTGTFFLTREEQAEYVRSALRLTRSWGRISAFGWDQLIDDAPDGRATERAGGLLDALRAPKPSYFAFRDG